MIAHAAREEIRFAYRFTGKPIAGLFDTQLAAMVCGYGDEAGYETLVTQVAKARIDNPSKPRLTFLLVPRGR